MGNRTVLGFAEHAAAPVIYLYSHWSAGQVEEVQKAIHAGEHCSHDSDYATRIAISEIIGDAWSSPLNYGISVDRYCNPDYDVVFVIVWSTRQVQARNANTSDILNTYTFEEFSKEAENLKAVLV
jgi:hypothetical protein